MTAAIRPVLTNADARRLFLARHGLLARPGGPARLMDIAEQVTQLGFVQVDSINTVARAHDHILWARRPQYRQGRLLSCVARPRLLFEAWTHDAALVPSQFFKHWRHKHAADRESLAARWQRWGREGFQAEFDRILRRIAQEGALSAKELGEGERQNGGGWWDWKPTKVALEYLWRSGELAICHRRSFSKVYDLTERVLPAEHLNARSEREESLAWSAQAALDRLGFATPSELSAFWDIFGKAELSRWAEKPPETMVGIDVENVDGSRRASLIDSDWETELAGLPEPSPRLRILSPFDPALRDRARIERLFGFSYRIEVFVPEARRQYGYYVYPVLEGTRLIGRIDIKADRAKGVLRVQGFWTEGGVKLARGRAERLADELGRLCGLAEVTKLEVSDSPKTKLLRENRPFMARL